MRMLPTLLGKDWATLTETTTAGNSIECERVSVVISRNRREREREGMCPPQIVVGKGLAGLVELMVEIVVLAVRITGMMMCPESVVTTTLLLLLLVEQM